MIRSQRPLAALASAHRALRYFSSADASVFRILAPTAILGYGFPRASFDAALAAHPIDLIAVDAGSVDPGPYYLATRSSFTSLSHVIRDLHIMLEGFVAQHHLQGRPCKLVVGSAGGCGTDNQLEVMAGEVVEMLRSIGGQDIAAATTLATVTSEVTDPAILEGRVLSPLGPMPGTAETARAAASGAGTSSAVVAQMGLEPIMCALEHADVVLCGRSYDPAVFAAEPVRRGFAAATALHAAKVLECGAIACVPGSGSDCLVAELSADGTATFWAPNKARQATPLSVAAHTLYEKSHPHAFGLPSGVLSTARTSFEARGNTVEVRGTSLARVTPAVKLEGAAVRGHRAVGLSLMGTTSDAVRVGTLRFVYGIDGVEARRVDASAGEQELGLVVSVCGADVERNKAHLALLRATLLHWGFEGRKATAGNLAFPFSPSDLLAPDGEVLTVCGTRDPGFIANWQRIICDTEAYVATLSSTEGLRVSFTTCGLPGMPRLGVEEAVAGSLEEAEAMLGPTGPEGTVERWLCSGGLAADYTLHHLVELDEELTRRLFQIRTMDGSGAGRACLEARLVPWGPGPVVSLEEAYAHWDASRKPKGGGAVGRPLGELTKVIRSKNAGVNELTYDLIFDSKAAYEVAKGSPALEQEHVQTLLGRLVLGIYCDDTSLAIKITCDRGLLAGSEGDRDVYGAQQHRRLVDLVL